MFTIKQWSVGRRFHLFVSIPFNMDMLHHYKFRFNNGERKLDVSTIDAAVLEHTYKNLDGTFQFV